MTLGSSSQLGDIVLPNLCLEDREIGQDWNSTCQESW